MTEEREPDGFKLAAEQNIASARFNARTAPKNTPQEQELLKHHRIMMTAAHNGVLATFSAMHLTLQKAVVNWHDADPASEGKTALIVAAGGGHLEIVKHLLSIGADISLVDDKGYAAVSRAAGSGKCKVLAALLDAGADINHRSTAGWTPLMGTVMNGKPEAAALLLDRGAETRILVPSGVLKPYSESLTALALRLGHEDIAELIIAEEKKRGHAVAAKLVEKGTAETITVSRPLRLKSPSV